MAQRVREACATLQYRPNRAARSLAGGRSVMVGLLIADIRIPFFMEIVCGAEATLKKHGYLPILCIFQELPMGVREYRQYIELMVAVPVAGAIVVPRSDHDPALKLFHEHDMPIVSVDQRLSDKVSDAVVIDNVAAAGDAVQHLIAKGYRRIGHISGPDSSMTGRDRALGYRAALDAAGIPYDPALECHGSYNEKTGYRFTHALLDLQPSIDALFTANYTITVGALHALQERGLRVPEAFGLAAFDEVPTLPGVPLVTCVVQPAYEMGVTAARRLVQRLEESGPHIRQEIVLPYQVRSGTAARPHVLSDGDALAV
jgi:LacI family transcriptional regulator